MESDRVQHILDNQEFDADPYDASQIHITDKHSTRPSTSLSGFYPVGSDLERLAEIDQSLQRIVPESDWETKSLVWSSVQASGTLTPVSQSSKGHPAFFGSSSRQPSHVGLFRGAALNPCKKKPVHVSSRGIDLETVLLDLDATQTEPSYKDAKSEMERIDEQLRILREGDADKLRVSLRAIMTKCILTHQ